MVKARHSRFVDEDLDWLGEEITPDELKEKGHFIQDPVTGLLQGSEPGSGHDEGGEGGGKEGGGRQSGAGKAKGEKVKDLSDFSKDDVGIEYPPTNPKDQEAFVEAWNTHVGKTPAEFKKEFFGGDKVNGRMSVQYDPSFRGGAISVQSRLKDDEGRNIGQMDATIFPQQSRVHMDYYLLDNSEQAHGVMKAVMAHEMQMWEEMGIKTVDLYADINVGGYAWARYGFEPENSQVWTYLANDLEYKVARMSTGEEGDNPPADSWDDISPAYQNRIEHSWQQGTYNEFLDSEISNWHDSGQALEQAKESLVGEFNSNLTVPWAQHTIDGYRDDQAEAGTPVPYTAQQIISSISLLYGSKHGDGRGDFEVVFNDDKLKPSENLTEEMRADITHRLERSFDTAAESLSNDVPFPDHLRDSVIDFQNEYWAGMDDSEKYAWAENNRSDLLSGLYSTPKGTGEMPQAEADVLLKLLRSDDPRAIWQVADSKWGKTLLLSKNWDGKFNMKDKAQMDRFRAYVGTAKKKET